MAAHVHIPATILFPQDEIGTYVRWQLQQPNIPQSQHWALPTALEYEAFTKWRVELRARCPNMRGRNFPNTDSIFVPSSPHQVQGNAKCDTFKKAEICGHPLCPALPTVFARWLEDRSGLSNPEDLHEYSSPSHPSPSSEDDKITPYFKENSTPLGYLHCPVCTLHIHLTFLSALLSSWSYYGGPWRKALRPAEDSRGEMYNFCNRAYHRAKVDMINAVQKFENWALAEKTWAITNPEVDIGVVEPYCAREAVRLFREQTTYPDGSVDKDFADLEEASNEDKSSPNKSAPCVAKKPKKKLIWTAETPQETRHTPTHRYNHHCTFWYNPHSPHACQDEEGWYDTSHMNDHLFALSQCRILRLVWSPGAEYMTYFDLNTTVISPEGTIIGRFGDNEHTHRLQSMVLQWLNTLQESEKWLEYLKTTADIFLVLKRD